MPLHNGNQIFDELILNPNAISSQHQEYLLALTEQYPFFTLAHYTAALCCMSCSLYAHDTLPTLEARLSVKPYPTILMGDYSSMLFDDTCDPLLSDAPFVPQTSIGDSSMDYIDQFLEQPLQRFVPNPNPANSANDYSYEDISLNSITENDEIISETLAQIYIQQGQSNKALDIYYKLSLKYPEKSVYFADLIRLYSNY